MWIARDKNGDLNLFDRLPVRINADIGGGKTIPVWDNDDGESMKLPRKWYAYRTWEDEPLEVDLVRHCKHLGGACMPDRFSDICNECKTQIFREVREKCG